MQYRTWKTYNCKFLVLAGYLRSFYQLLFVNFGFGSLSFPFNCHLKQYSNLVFFIRFTYMLYTYMILWILGYVLQKSDPWIARWFSWRILGGGGPKECSKTTLDMRILSSFLIFPVGVGNLHLPAATIRNATTISRAAKRLHKECPACQHCKHVSWSW